MGKGKYAVRLLPVAEEDLYGIVDYIASENRSAAEKLALKFEKYLTHLSSYPLLGRVPKEEELAQMGYRFLVIANYLLFYTVEETTVFIHRIIHGAREYLHLLQTINMQSP